MRPPTAARIVVSVGPYALTIARFSDHRRATGTGSTSPPESSMRSVGTASDGVAASTAGDDTTCVTPSAAISCASGSPATTSPSAITRVAPASAAVRISWIEASNDSDATCSTRESGVAAYVVRSVESRPAIPRCDTTTALGCPVDPDVCTIHAGFSARSGRSRSASVTGAVEKPGASGSTSRTLPGSSTPRPIAKPTTSRCCANRSGGSSGSTGT